MARIPPGSDIPLEQRLIDMNDDRLMEEFIGSGCGCWKWKGKPCSQQFTAKYIRDTCLSLRDLERSQLDLIMGQLMAFANTSDSVVVESGHRQTERKKSYTTHYHQGKEICQVMFRFLHGVGTMRMKNITRRLREDGVVPRVHGNTRRMPKHTLSLESVEYVLLFLLNYTEEHGLLLTHPPTHPPTHNAESNFTWDKGWKAGFDGWEE